jgi:F-type H+-transporting ATPase subunit delta
LIDLCGESLDKSGQNFVRVLANNKRLSLLPEVFKLFEELKAEREKTIEVEVISAFSMDAQAQQKLSVALKNRLKREIKLNTRVDKFLIGGIVVRAGDLVIDGSIRGKLNKLAETMNA